MCLGIPGRVVEVLDGYHDQVALVDVEGARRRVNIGLLDDDPARPGDWIVIHMGFAVDKTDEAGAKAALDGLRLLGRGEPT